jgi:hypothetical protein
VASAVSDVEKRRALQRVVDSRAFSRSAQLRQLLSYVCEAALAGRGHELNEHLLGVAVFGRPPAYSPTEDSCVRSRAYELRKRLRAYYETEARADPIRIVVDKGGYCPRFERSAEPTLPAEPGQPLLTLAPELGAFWGPRLGAP